MRRRFQPFPAESAFEKLFEDLFGWVFKADSGAWGLRPKIDIYEKGNSVFVRAELPGVKTADIRLSVDGSTLTISGEKKEEREIKKDNCYQAEGFYGRFQRTVELPAEVKAEGAKATYRDGILKIELPKSESQRRKEIRIE
jgi:HSP20 family protein